MAYTLKEMVARIFVRYAIRNKRNLEASVNASISEKGAAPPPETAWIDPVNLCNLQCPLCPTGLHNLKHPQGMMTINTFETIIQKIPSLKTIHLYNWGEPFLNPDLFLLIKHAKKHKIMTEIHSNFSQRRPDDFFINLIRSGLDTLVVSLDGASQESYAAYRRCGSFDLVISNIEALVSKKAQMDSKTPRIIWKFLVNSFNEGEIDRAKEMAIKLGIEFKTEGIGLGDLVPDRTLDTTIEQRKAHWLPEDKSHILERFRENYSYPIFDTACPFLFSSVVLTPGGKVFPCCFATDEKNYFGDLMHDSFDNIWHNAKYRYARSLFTNEKYIGPEVSVVCSNCNNFQKRK